MSTGGQDKVQPCLESLEEEVHGDDHVQPRGFVLHLPQDIHEVVDVTDSCSEDVLGVVDMVVGLCQVAG
eukprot:scaffold4941_cov179-Ochromonas_danica.AAC.10